jgi:hypothetical protein
MSFTVLIRFAEAPFSGFRRARVDKVHHAALADPTKRSSLF